MRTLMSSYMSNEESKHSKPYGKCQNCKYPRIGLLWCQPCESNKFKNEWGRWTSGVTVINAFIQEVQCTSQSACQIIEWIPYEDLTNVTFIRRGGFAKVSSAIWSKGPLLNWNENENEWVREENHMVALKELNYSSKMSKEFLAEIKNHANCNGIPRIIRYYGLSRNPKTNNYIMVMRYAPSGNLRDYLRENPTLIHKGALPEFKSDFPKILKELITKCWDNNPSNRPDANKIHESFLEMCHMSREDFQYHFKNLPPFITNTNWPDDQKYRSRELLPSRNIFSQTTRNYVFSSDVVSGPYSDSNILSVNTTMS
ncbi:2967_t:CDS:2 [Acaulospora morrowiae]|uniref:2967_t:CDS:1 n=1 Tax=Acaulospora morrowiae TaxID=94023 RepID=A0A9N9F2W5_9GLOM|nr:2967_t:CDS:2 [Acaulospora morrowiae]